MTDPNPAHMLRYCTTVVPDILTKACAVDGDLAERIGADILDRAEVFAALPADQRRVLIAPFLEEAFHHRATGRVSGGQSVRRPGGAQQPA
jgi:hypothetical protein